PPERTRDDKDEFRYEMLNRSAACQRAIAHPRILEVIEPLLGDDCHVIANTAWRNPPEFPGGFWHCDGGPHVPRAEDVPWDDRIPYPVFAIGAHILLQDCTLADGPTAVVQGSHRSGRLAPFDRMHDEDLSYDGRPPAILEGVAGADDHGMHDAACMLRHDEVHGSRAYRGRARLVGRRPGVDHLRDGHACASARTSRGS